MTIKSHSLFVSWSQPSGSIWASFMPAGEDHIVATHEIVCPPASSSSTGQQTPIENYLTVVRKEIANVLSDLATEELSNRNSDNAYAISEDRMHQELRDIAFRFTNTILPSEIRDEMCRVLVAEKGDHKHELMIVAPDITNAPWEIVLLKTEIEEWFLGSRALVRAATDILGTKQGSIGVVGNAQVMNNVHIPPLVVSHPDLSQFVLRIPTQHARIDITKERDWEDVISNGQKCRAVVAAGHGVAVVGATPSNSPARHGVLLSGGEESELGGRLVQSSLPGNAVVAYYDGISFANMRQNETLVLIACTPDYDNPGLLANLVVPQRNATVWGCWVKPPLGVARRLLATLVHALDRVSAAEGPRALHRCDLHRMVAQEHPASAAMMRMWAK